MILRCAVDLIPTYSPVLPPYLKFYAHRQQPGFLLYYTSIYPFPMEIKFLTVAFPPRCFSLPKIPVKTRALPRALNPSPSLALHAKAVQSTRKANIEMAPRIRTCSLFLPCSTLPGPVLSI